MSRSEQAVFTNLCMVYDKFNRILVQNRVKQDWPGLAFPGGHVEYLESFHDAVIREVKEETGLDIKNPMLCGIKQFQTENDERYVVLFYKTNQYSGEIVSSSEGEVFWIDRKDLKQYCLSLDFEEMLQIFDSDTLSEFYYYKENGNWEKSIF